MIDLRDTTLFIAKWEGFKSRPYRNFPGEPWTVGFGETNPAFVNKFFSPNPPCTREEALVQLENRVREFAQFVALRVTVAINRNQFGALTSLCYNIGMGAFEKSTVLKRFNAGDAEGARQAIMMWNKVNGREVQGLTNRRREEMIWFAQPVEIDIPLEEDIMSASTGSISKDNPEATIPLPPIGAGHIQFNSAVVSIACDFNRQWVRAVIGSPRKGWRTPRAGGDVIVEGDRTLIPVGRMEIPVEPGDEILSLRYLGAGEIQPDHDGKEHPVFYSTYGIFRRRG